MTGRAPCKNTARFSAHILSTDLQRPSLTLARDVALAGHLDVFHFDDPLAGAVGVVGIRFEVPLRRVRVEVAWEDARIGESSPGLRRGSAFGA